MRKYLLKHKKSATKEEAIELAIKAHDRVRNYAVKTGLWAFLTLVSVRELVDKAECLAAWIKAAKHNDKVVENWVEDSE